VERNGSEVLELWRLADGWRLLQELREMAFSTAWRCAARVLDLRERSSV
jgi:hypothetical protein